MNKQPFKSPRNLNIYDFDHTVYKGDSSLDFYFFCLRRNPLLLRYLPFQLLHAALFVCKLEKRTDFKSHFFVFLRGISDTTKYVDRFWDSHRPNIKSWYKATDYRQGVIISASPDFLLRPILATLGMHTLIATVMDETTGTIEGENCRGAEKVIRLRKLFPDAKINEAYSDSRADLPMLRLANKSYIVRGENISPLAARG